MDIKENLAANLAALRKAAGLTQAELAEKFNYSDKAVSKWERGESAPDVFVLAQLADFYNVTLDRLVSEPKTQKTKTILNKDKIRTIICWASVCLAWLVAFVAFVLLGIFAPQIHHKWLAFIYAIPVSCIIVLTLARVWGRNLTTAVFISLLIWSTITAVFLTLLFTLSPTPAGLWELYLIGIPLQVLTVLWTAYKKIK